MAFTKLPYPQKEAHLNKQLKLKKKVIKLTKLHNFKENAVMASGSEQYHDQE